MFHGQADASSKRTPSSKIVWGPVFQVVAVNIRNQHQCNYNTISFEKISLGAEYIADIFAVRQGMPVGICVFPDCFTVGRNFKEPPFGSAANQGIAAGQALRPRDIS